jgi:glycerol-3-phosphate dehydrogenase
MIGTTDLDDQSKEDESRIAPLEYEYLMEAARHAFPDSPVGDADLIASFAGVRPVVNTNAPTPSQESRAHQVWEEDGLVTVSGGKLTIFRVMAADVLNFCHDRLPGDPKFDHQAPCFIHPEPEASPKASVQGWQMMAGRLGEDVNAFFDAAEPDALKPIDPLPQFWAELAWAAANEAVVHLDDLLLRRVRVGLLMPQGGLGEIEQIQKLVQGPLGWSDETWQAEVARYRGIWQGHYHLPHA